MMSRPRWLGCIALVALSGCLDRPLETTEPKGVEATIRHFPQSLDKEVDILFVIDNSYSMAGLQAELATQFPRLIDALRTPKLANGIPDVRIGVVSTDLGAGPFTIGVKGQGQGGCEPEGDRGLLQRTPRVPGCTPPSDPWIEYHEGRTNVPAGSADPVARVKEAFSCIARLGDQGCGFESPLQAARLALDPKEKRNPGFLRRDALLAVVFITNEDDCSAKDVSLFDNTQTKLDDPLGPLDSFRCFEFGFRCDVNDRKVMGPRRGCRPVNRYLFEVDEYVRFLKGLKPEGRVLTAVIAGPPEPVAVVNSSSNGIEPTLQASCRGTVKIAGGGDNDAPHGDPGLRMKALSDAFGADGQFTSICADDFGPSLQRLGQRIITSLGQQCLTGVPLTRLGAIACASGDTFGSPQTSCRGSCLEQADCKVSEYWPYQSDRPEAHIERCPAELFLDASRKDCGSSCPCWRLTASADCGAEPHALEILRGQPADPGTFARLSCATVAGGDLAALPHCQ